MFNAALAALLAFTVVVVVPAYNEPAQAAPPAVNLDQCRNGAADSPTDPCDWVNGNAGAQNSHYVEGFSIPYRAIMTDLPTDGTVIELDLGYDIKHSFKHAIDFLTHFDRLEPHNEGFGHPAETVTPTSGYGPFGTTTTYPIPAPENNGGGQPGAEFASLPAGEKVFTLYGGTITNIEYLDQGVLADKRAETSIRVTFTVDSETAILAWGGHI
ncbi:MAG: T9SS C-terminal target domain-containing protein, partial [Actinomycetota bacterium]